MGSGADQFAVDHSVGSPFKSADEARQYLITPHTLKTFQTHLTRWEQANATDAEPLLKRKKPSDDDASPLNSPSLSCHDNNLGTVGCICIDSSRQISAGTSSGGVSLKKSHRVGQVRTLWRNSQEREVIGLRLQSTVQEAGRMMNVGLALLVPART